MTRNSSERQTELRALIQGFLSERLEGKLEKLKPEDPKRTELKKEFDFDAWLASAAKRVSQIQAVTHSLKPAHPDAKGTNLFCAPTELPSLSVLGSHALSDGFASDVVGNAAALDVYKLLKLQFEGTSLLDLAVAKDVDLIAVLNRDAVQAQEWAQSFAGLVGARGRLSSHTQAKQLYWFTGNDPHDDAHFHLLAPLYATSLTHHVYQTVQDHRFSDEAKTAREARRSGEFSERAVHEYSHMAVQKLGGTKPQNISQLNSERRGDNYLLASLPPTWNSQGVRPLLGIDDLFDLFGARRAVRLAEGELSNFLQANPAPTEDTRSTRASMVMALIDELLQFGASFRDLVPGWSQDPECRLSAAQRHWLDPMGVASAVEAAGAAIPSDTDAQIAEGFSRWLNSKLRKVLPVSDVEFLHWRKMAIDELKVDEWEVGNER